MIVEYIRYEIRDEAAFLSAYEAARHSLDTSSHCLAYELSRCAQPPNASTGASAGAGAGQAELTSFILRIEWDSADGHMLGFRRSPEFRPFLAAVRPFIDDIREMRHYEVTTIASRKPTL